MFIHFHSGVLTRKLHSFALSDSGMTVPLLALSFMAISGFVGVAVDIARVQLVQSKLSYSLDAAGLAAGATMNTQNIETEVAKYLQSNFPAGYLGATSPSVGVVLSDNNMVIDLSATTTVPMTFMSLFGVPSTSVSATAQITRTASGLELVLALDNTGSMNGTKLSALKSASTSLINILFGGRESVRDLWVGLVPFSQAVNIGTGHPAWMDTTWNSALNWGPTTWMGCVDANERDGRDVNDDPPSVQTLRAYYSPSTDNRPYPYNTWSYINENKWVTSRDAYGNPLTYASGLGVTIGPNKYCPQQIQPLTGSKTTILNAVNTMEARGNTHIGLGLAWGWRMISPRWRGLWGGEMDANNLPLDYDAPHMNKAVILLTDGENTMSGTVFTAYGYLSDGRLGTTSSSAAVTSLNTRMTTLCDAVKAQGVYVYTIVLGTPGTTVQNLMRNCATAENYYFYSPTTEELNSVFNAIGDSLSNLRVSQ